MFFLIRSAFCIGAVALMLPGDEGASVVRDVTAVTRSASAAEAWRYCARHGECVVLSAKLAGLPLRADASPRRTAGRGPISASTLDAADLVPPWSGPKPQRLGVSAARI